MDDPKEAQKSVTRVFLRHELQTDFFSLLFDHFNLNSSFLTVKPFYLSHAEYVQSTFLRFQKRLRQSKLT